MRCVVVQCSAVLCRAGGQVMINYGYWYRRLWGVGWWLVWLVRYVGRDWAVGGGREECPTLRKSEWSGYCRCYHRSLGVPFSV